MRDSVNVKVELKQPSDGDRERIEKILTSVGTAEFLTHTFNTDDMTNIIVKGGLNTNKIFICPLLVQAHISTTSRLSGRTDVESVVVGVIVLSNSRDYMNTLNIFYVIDSDYRNLGICSKAMSKLLENVPTGSTPVSRLQLIIVDGNIASMKVAEHVGFQLEGVARKCMVVGNEAADCYIYSYTYGKPLEAGRVGTLFSVEPAQEAASEQPAEEENVDEQVTEDANDYQEDKPDEEQDTGENETHATDEIMEETAEPDIQIKTSDGNLNLSSLSFDVAEESDNNTNTIDIALQLYDEMSTDIQQDLSASEKNKDKLTDRNNINQSFGKMLSDMLGSIDDTPITDTPTQDEEMYTEPDMSEAPSDDRDDKVLLIGDDDSKFVLEDDMSDEDNDAHSDYYDISDDYDESEDEDEDGPEDEEEDEPEEGDGSEGEDESAKVELGGKIEDSSTTKDFSTTKENSVKRDSHVNISCLQNTGNTQTGSHITTRKLNLTGLTKNKLTKTGKGKF